MPLPYDQSDKPVPAKIMQQILGDRALMQQLSDRVYELFLDDMRRHKERTHRYGRRN